MPVGKRIADPERGGWVVHRDPDKQEEAIKESKDAGGSPGMTSGFSSFSRKRGPSPPGSSKDDDASSSRSAHDAAAGSGSHSHAKQNCGRSLSRKAKSVAGSNVHLGGFVAIA